MRSLTLRKIAVVAVVPLALGSLAACGSSNGGSTTAADPAGSSSTTPSTAPSASAATAGSRMSSADFLALAKAAAGKITTVKVDMVGEMSSAGKYSMKGAMDVTGDQPAMDVTMSMGSAGLSDVEMRLVDNVVYLNLGTMTQDKFVKFDLSDANSPLGQLSSSLDQLDPAKMMSEMSPDVFRAVRFVGSDADGRHYRATLVTAKAPQVKGLPSTSTSSLPKTMRYDTWLDDQGRFSKFEVSVPGYLDLTAHYTDYGAPVHVVAPPASQITTMPGGTTNS